jgi:hypothetical protein
VILPCAIGGDNNSDDNAGDLFWFHGRVFTLSNTTAVLLSTSADAKLVILASSQIPAAQNHRF